MIAIKFPAMFAIGLAMTLAIGQAKANQFTISSDLSQATEPYATTYSAIVSLATGASSQTLTIDLTNTTSSSAIGGNITGIVFALPTAAPFNGSFCITKPAFAPPQQ